MIFVATKKAKKDNNFYTLSFLLFLDPGGMDKNQDPRSGIDIPDPQHFRCKSYRVVYM
jgi:hypothetical protein